MENAQPEKSQIVIVAAGFGGLEAAKKLAYENVRVTVIDHTNYHLFQPLILLIGFQNRPLVLIQWAWAYLTFDAGARLITRNFQSETRPPA